MTPKQIEDGPVICGLCRHELRTLRMRAGVEPAGKLHIGPMRSMTARTRSRWAVAFSAWFWLL